MLKAVTSTARPATITATEPDTPHHQQHPRQRNVSSIPLRATDPTLEPQQVAFHPVFLTLRQSVRPASYNGEPTGSESLIWNSRFAPSTMICATPGPTSEGWSENGRGTFRKWFAPDSAQN
nr:hypothetical protein [Fluviibacter phosphoraccumulans]